MSKRKIEKEIEIYQRELIDIHYLEVETMYNKMRGWKHDYKNHIQTMKILADTGDLEALRAYLNDLDDDLTKLDTLVRTGNVMADAILNSKINLALSNDICVKVDVEVPVKLKINELDLCVILGNLFDNAIEASLKLPIEDRLIRIYMVLKNTQLYISFTNLTATKKLTKISNIYKTSKGSGHGFGLIRIDSIVDKLEGYISRNSEDGAFTTEILLPQL